jgi:mRNA interferase RelE/StbE
MDRGVALRIISRLELLAEIPRPAGCTKLEGARDLWRIRVGDYRVIYRADDSAMTVDVRIVRHRRDVYRF